MLKSMLKLYISFVRVRVRVCVQRSFYVLRISSHTIKNKYMRTRTSLEKNEFN